MEILPREHWLKSRVIQTVKEMLKKTDHMRDAQEALPEEDKEAVRRIKITGMKMADGSIQAQIEVDDSHY